jgi:hypothetical protein
MKIKRQEKPDIVIGKRVTFGAIVGGMVSFGVWLWNATHPEIQIPAGITTVFTGIGQIGIGMRWGVTQ